MQTQSFPQSLGPEGFEYLFGNDRTQTKRTEKDAASQRNTTRIGKAITTLISAQRCTTQGQQHESTSCSASRRLSTPHTVDTPGRTPTTLQPRVSKVECTDEISISTRGVPRTGFWNGASTLKQYFVLPKNGSKYYPKYTFLAFPVLGILGLGTPLISTRPYRTLYPRIDRRGANGVSKDPMKRKTNSRNVLQIYEQCERLVRGFNQVLQEAFQIENPLFIVIS